MLRCDHCNQPDYVTQIYLDNLSNTGWNLLLCRRCFTDKSMYEILEIRK